MENKQVSSIFVTLSCSLSQKFSNTEVPPQKLFASERPNKFDTKVVHPCYVEIFVSSKWPAPTKLCKLLSPLFAQK